MIFSYGTGLAGLTFVAGVMIGAVLGSKVAGRSIMVSAYPRAEEIDADPGAEAEMQWLMNFILGVRQIRGEMDIAPARRLDVPHHVDDVAGVLRSQLQPDLSTQLARGQQQQRQVARAQRVGVVHGFDFSQILLRGCISFGRLSALAPTPPPRSRPSSGDMRTRPAGCPTPVAGAAMP